MCVQVEGLVLLGSIGGLETQQLYLHRVLPVSVSDKQNSDGEDPCEGTTSAKRLQDSGLAVCMCG